MKGFACIRRFSFLLIGTGLLMGCDKGFIPIDLTETGGSCDSCDTNDTNDTGDNGDNNDPGDSTDSEPLEELSLDSYYSAAKEVGPTIEEPSSTALILTEEATRSAMFTSSLPLSNLYEALRDYRYPEDEGQIDMHNIYKFANTADQIFSMAEGNCSSITEGPVDSPFDLGVTDTYTCAGNNGTMTESYANGFAIKTTDGIRHALLTFRWVSSEHGILQGSYDNQSGDLDLRMVELVDHDQSRFYLRSHLTGNARTHAFSLTQITGSIADLSSYVSFVGKGVSKGEGNYFLMKAQTETIDGNYFCLPAGASSATLESLAASAPNGSTTVEEACAIYHDDVDTMTFLTTEDVPLTLADFEDSSILIHY